MTHREWLSQAGSLALAILLAVLVWLAATQNDRPMRTVNAYPVPPAEGIPVTPPPLPTGWSAYDIVPATVRLGVRGLQDGLEQLTPNSFVVRAEADLLPGREAEYTLPLRVICASCSRRGIRVRGIQPDTVRLRVARTVTRTFAVVAEPAETVPTGYRFVATNVSPTRAAASGASAAVSRVVRLVARLSTIESVGEEQRFHGVPIQALDVAGRPLAGVAVVPAEAEVWATLERRALPVAVYPDVTGMNDVADGYVVGAFTTEPEVVELIGPPELLRQMQDQGRVTTAPVDVTGASGRLEKRVALELPDGVTALNAPAGVTVTVEVEPLPGTATLDMPVTVRSLANGLTATVTPSRVRVLLSGPRPELERIQPADVAVYADVAGRGAGSHRVRLRMEAPPGVRLRSITPEQVEIEIRSLWTPTAPRPLATGTR